MRKVYESLHAIRSNENVLDIGNVPNALDILYPYVDAAFQLKLQGIRKTFNTMAKKSFEDWKYDLSLIFTKIFLNAQCYVYYKIFFILYDEIKNLKIEDIEDTSLWNKEQAEKNLKRQQSNKFLNVYILECINTLNKEYYMLSFRVRYPDATVTP